MWTSWKQLATTDRSQWLDTAWLSYQNINLIADASGTIYLAGMATKKGAGNFLDMYRLTPKGTNDFQLTKIHSRTFLESETSKFEWGAGIYSHKNQQLKVFSTGDHFTPTATLLRFEWFQKNIQKHCSLVFYHVFILEKSKIKQT